MGRSTFELAREYDDVVGVDFSRAFVAKCNELKRDGMGDYAMVVEGDLVDCKTAYVDATIVSPATSYDRFIVLYIKMEFSRVNNFCVFHISYSSALYSADAESQLLVVREVGVVVLMCHGDRSSASRTFVSTNLLYS